ncbi:RCC1/BLIP-II [Amniculicola lignicola CBS 123094]|uniref:RCC1/BLIP-II n=1 Tax=Amniculicola lignicola CBS 123094 TaxID=1392246 RepID=A0A6A5W2E3_9PLEO|nr:RCC1/BLIP-II [Amniculicola lignicola CBS 123094]
MADRISSITDLPLDVIVLVFPYLDVKSFLAFCSTCKGLHQNSISLDPAYWSHATRSTFRVPNQPVVQHDGVRWQKMYRRLLTQSRVYTWGSTTYNRLGHGYDPDAVRVARHAQRRFQHRQSTRCSFPTEMEKTRELGVIADMQCGGWSTTLLTSRGALYTAGVLDGMQGAIQSSSSADGPQPLGFPAGYPASADQAAYDEPTVAIRQFSSGRSHILALSDTGRIWSWYAVHRPALQIKFLNVDLKESPASGQSKSTTSLYGHVKKVVAGWSRSSAYIHGVGIVVWDPVQRDGDEETDATLVLDSAEVPCTGYQRIKGASRPAEEKQKRGQEIGVVTNHIMLEHFVVFATDTGKVFCARFGDQNAVESILELRSLRNSTGAACDVQGSFRSLAIFKNGEVITAHTDYLEACWDARHSNPDQTDIPGLKRIPALQQTNVISVAFGDYHFLALHSNGKITSYGTELQACGALGLGGDGDPEGRARGIRYTGFGHDGRMLPHAYTHGRQVWFEREKKRWITFMTSGGTNPDEAKERMRMFVTEVSVQGEISEWFEQQGRDWDKDPQIRDADEDGLGAYFALSVSAAGWHSGSLVLVNETLADRVTDMCTIRDPDLTDSEPDGDSEASPGILAASLTRLSNMGQAVINLGGNRNQTPAGQAFTNFLDPVNHGASPREGYKYVWADKSFPRLRLSDGREMPGRGDFDEWRYGRPEWKLGERFEQEVTAHW